MRMALDSDRINKPIIKLRKLLKKMSDEPSPKQVHDLRTNSRRLEAMLQATNSDQNSSKVLKQVSKLRKRAGKVRDMDVLTAFAAELPQSDDEDSCLIRLLEHLGGIRRKQATRLGKAAQESASHLRKRLKRTSKKLQNRVSRPNSAEASSHVTSAALRALSELQRPTVLNKSNLHPYRLQVKELQNLLRLAEDNADTKFVESLGEVKDAIGEWHDWLELGAIAQKVLDHPQCGLMREIKKRTEERFDRALKLALQMRRTYLRGSGAKRGPKRSVPHPSEPVWSATAALAA